MIIFFLFLCFKEQIWQAALNHRCCFLYLQHKIDMEEVLSYLLTPFPLSLCQVDGLNKTTPKVKTLYELESRIPNDIPLNVGITVIDAMFFLHLQKQFLEHLKPCLCAETENELFDKVQLKIVKEMKDQKTSIGSRTIRSLDLGNTHQVTG